MALKNNWKTLVDGVDYVSAEPINQIAEAVIAVEDKTDTVKNNIDTHILDKENPHKVTAGQTGAYTTIETDNKITEVVNPVANAVSGKLDKVTESYPGTRVYGVSVAGEQIMLRALKGYHTPGDIPIYDDNGVITTGTPTADDSAANKGYVDGKINALKKPYELIETITLTEATASIERSSEPDGTAYNFKKLLIYMNAALTDQTGLCGVDLWDGTTLAARSLSFGSSVKTTSSDYMMELSLEDGILHQTAPETADKEYLSTITKTAAATYFGGVKMMDKISKIQINQYNGITFAVGTVIKIYGVRA